MDRAAIALLDAAEQSGRLHPSPDAEVVVASTGALALSLAVVCAVREYRLTVAMADGGSRERRALLAVRGVELARTAEGDGFSGARARAGEIAKSRGACLIDAFDPAQASVCQEAHQNAGREILAHLGAQRIDAFVAGVGSGATLLGIGRALRHRWPECEIVAVTAAGAPLFSETVSTTRHAIEGIAVGLAPPGLERAFVTHVHEVSDHEAFGSKERMARAEGLLVGLSAGAALHGAIATARRLGVGKTVVTVLPDGGDRYFSLGSVS
jgi:cysteine synthase A